MANAADVESLKQSRSNVVAIVAAQTAAWVAAGMPPTFSVDGESYSWNEWLKARSDEIQGLTETIRIVGGSWIVRTRGKV